MRDDSDPDRDAIHEALQKNSPQSRAGSLLTGWVLVTEWMDADGDKTLAKAHSANVASWAANGYHFEALHGAWPDEEDDE